MAALADAALLLDSFNSAVREFRIYITEGNIGDAEPVFPTQPTLSVSATPTGIFERLDAFVKRIRVAPQFTPEIGALLGINPTPTQNIIEADLKPVIKASESYVGYSFSVNVTRLGMPAFKVQIQRTGEAVWQDNGMATSNPAEIVITPTTAGQPERILVRAILLDKNVPVGIPSDPTFVTVNP